ncbi:hypothetical protein [Exercitatus varius]|uniref:Uncharacterized protein n=1 Tax=Exercitatus varius TaxID=67857 RepID=A0ABT6ESI4_9PAST|nr:hypothetical protein [Exercitatus varius]MDG2939830.1 hypothetical protein [Exercitatus varius]MDG2943235.1 hypothetical protein [Exercitatus varius]MDG2946514.1 hypothetical protein [Exercitatus varius]MDG2958949.1 hypothetical protein [Exercitatus varius]MDG2962352.1 hypothetical protein [Exercitatus varius]
MRQERRGCRRVGRLSEAGGLCYNWYEFYPLSVQTDGVRFGFPSKASRTKVKKTMLFLTALLS